MSEQDRQRKDCIVNRLRPFRFGVLAFGGAARQAFVALARCTEALGYATFAISNHLNCTLAPIAAMATAAEIRRSPPRCTNT